jgi:hypothetical protein
MLEHAPLAASTASALGAHHEAARHLENAVRVCADLPAPRRSRPYCTGGSLWSWPTSASCFEPTSSS